MFNAIVLALCSLFVLLLPGTPAIAADTSWITGRWELTQDPDGSPKDFLEFTADGKVKNINPQGKDSAGTYQISGRLIQFNITLASGKTVELSMTYTADKKRLLLYSNKTRNTAIYEKVK